MLQLDQPTAPLLSLAHMPHTEATPATKRMFDIGLAMMLFPVAVPMCAVAALMIWREDKANPLFVQYRLGRNGRKFRLIKLRTMRIDTGDRPSHETMEGSITRIGALLRRTKLDELPQIWNIVRGEMSFVGPRPGLPSQVELADSRRRHGVDRLIPGITGVAQVAGLDMSTPQHLAEIDASYLGKWSLRRDLLLLWKTAMGGGRGDAAAR